MTCHADHLVPAAVGIPRSLRAAAARFSDKVTARHGPESHKTPFGARVAYGVDRVRTSWEVAPLASARVYGGSGRKPISFGIGTEPGHHEHRSPRTSVPTEASG
jgi:hypothetical protein